MQRRTADPKNGGPRYRLYQEGNMGDTGVNDVIKRLEAAEQTIRDLKAEVDALKQKVSRLETSIPNPSY